MGDLQDKTDERVSTVQGNLELNVGRMNQQISELDQSCNTQIENHSSMVKKLLESSLNPINAYLNSMHIKADAVRVDLDEVIGKVPTLQSSIADVSSQLKKSDTE